MPATRDAAFAGRFYPASAHQCREMSAPWLNAASATPAVGAVAPHAGWVYSGSTAALGISSIAAAEPETVVVFGAVHVLDRNASSLYATGVWTTPLGPIQIDEELAREVANCRHVVIDPGIHAQEHSIEVELPLIQTLLPNVKLLPIMIRPGAHARKVGRYCASAALDLGRRVGFLASTDLTHYGPTFGFEPAGHGEEGVRWAKEINDRRFIDLVAELDSEGVVPEAMQNRNACGAGAVAATIEASLAAGASRHIELRHTSSAEVDVGRGSRDFNSVGYVAGIFVRD